MSGDDWGGEFAAPVKQVRAGHSRIREGAPRHERVLTVVCGTRVVAAVWPLWSSQRYLVTAGDTTSLDHPYRLAIAPCRCARRQHVLDLDKVTAVARAAGAASTAQVNVARVSPDADGSRV